MNLSALSAFVLLTLVFSSFHEKAAAFNNDSNLNKTQQMLNAFAATSSSCQNSINQCVLSIQKYSALRYQERFCDIIEQQADDSAVTNCVAEKLDNRGCTNDEIGRLHRIACDEETLEEKFNYAIETTSAICQSTVYSCILQSQSAKQYIADKKYCDLFDIEEDGRTAEQCVTGGGCTSSEFTKLRDVACGACGFAATVVVVMLSLILAGIFIR